MQKHPFSKSGLCALPGRVNLLSVRDTDDLQFPDQQGEMALVAAAFWGQIRQRVGILVPQAFNKQITKHKRRRACSGLCKMDAASGYGLFQLD
jgi:hypothetical protein